MFVLSKRYLRPVIAGSVLRLALPLLVLASAACGQSAPSVASPTALNVAGAKPAATPDPNVLTLANGGSISPCRDGMCDLSLYALPRGTIVRKIESGQNGGTTVVFQGGVLRLDRNAKQCQDAEYEWKYAVRPTAVRCGYQGMQGVISAY
jgi:hypothetical protein